ncbi:cytochrome C oxidase subunit IV family protein [Anatilimnocola sp. NA78]|uniref:cytochrome C oxidase subunit IV family protein n=1 Tax=Anatilimnocola sp. NA78 TaxID=3415683 RepID=UPI003CE4E501
MDHDHGIDKQVHREHLGATTKAHASHGGLGVYLGVFVALCVLTLISFLVGNSQTLRQEAPQVMWAAMMAVSVAKALLVMLFFMHLKWEANWKYVLTIPASMMSLFLVLMLVPDIGRRTRYYSDDRWLHSAKPVVEVKKKHDADHSHPPAKSGEGH